MALWLTGEIPVPVLFYDANRCHFRGICHGKQFDGDFPHLCKAFLFVCLGRGRGGGGGGVGVVIDFTSLYFWHKTDS